MRVLVAMSGGVDSAVAALLLREQGHEVVGMTLRVHDDPDRSKKSKTCCAPKDIHDARDVAVALGIPFYAVDMREAFHRQVIRPFAAEYLNGRTPNPCVLCNSHLKFGDLFKRAKALGLDAVATGHYARRRGDDTLGSVRLFRGKDRHKDQSYFLFALTRRQLSRTLFPLGDYTKEEVRQRATAAGIPVASKPESQEICFVPDGDYAKVVAQTLPKKTQAIAAGAIVDEDHRRIGSHSGIHQFTVGQRRGLGVQRPQPLYVLGIDKEKNEVQVGARKNLLKTSLTVSTVNWLSDPLVFDQPLHCQVAIRYRHTAAAAQVRLTETGDLCVDFDQPQTAITPGQAAVFYDQDRVLGGGWIQK